MNRTILLTGIAMLMAAALVVPIAGNAYATDIKNKAIAENDSTNIAQNNATSSSTAVSSSESNNVNQISNTNVNQNTQDQHNNQTMSLLELGLGCPPFCGGGGG